MGLILVGMISGIITGLGMGGGSILILVLVNLMNIEQHTAQATNLIFFIPTAITAICVHIKNKNIDKKVSKKLLLPVIFGSGFGAYLTRFNSAKSLKKYFGVFLLFIGIIEIILTIKEHIKEKEGEDIK